MNFIKIRFFHFLLLFPVLLHGLNENKLKDQNSNWIQEILAGQKYGCWKTLDRNGKEVILEGERIACDINENKIISEFGLENIAYMFATTSKSTHIELIKKHPSILLLPSMWLIFFKMLFSRKNYTDLLQDGYIEEITDIYNQKNDYQIYLFTVSELDQDGDKSLLGSIMFYIKNNYEYGSAEPFHLFVKPEAQGRGLSKILMSGILKLLPQTEKFVFDVASTNRVAINIYEKFGAKKCSGGIYNLSYEYVIADHPEIKDFIDGFKEF